MKKFVSILFVAALCLSVFAGCSSTGSEETTAPTEEVVETETPTEAPETETPTEEPSEEPTEAVTEEPTENVEGGTGTDESTEIVTDPSTFTESAGVTLTEPEGASETAYYLVNGVIAEMSFTLDSTAFTLRATADADASATLTDAYSIQEDDTQTAEATSGEETAAITIYNTAEGGTVAVWTWGGVTFCLYTEMARTEAVVNSIVNIATANAQTAGTALA